MRYNSKRILYQYKGSQMKKVLYAIASAWIAIANVYADSTTDSNASDTNGYSNIGLMIEFIWIGGHDLRKSPDRQSKWMDPLMWGYRLPIGGDVKAISFITSPFWASGRFSDSIPFWLWTFWDGQYKGAFGMIQDAERKSLCYIPNSVGCLIPYVEDFKLDKPIFATASKKSHILRKTSKDDIIFALALTSDEKFYQVIVFPNMQKILAEITQTKSTKSLELDGMLESRNQNLPINGFIEAKYLPNALKNHNPATKLDPAYKDVRVFDTPPKIPQEK